MLGGERFEQLRFHERQVAADTRVPPIAGACRVAITGKPDTGERACSLARTGAFARRPGDVDVLDGSHREATLTRGTVEPIMRAVWAGRMPGIRLSL
jgi:hypothetical protein